MTPTYVEGGSLSLHVDVDANRDVVAYLDSHALYCHSDLGQAIVDEAMNACGEWTAYSPSFASFRYVALLTSRRVFALAHDMAFICVRLTDACFATALESGTDRLERLYNTAVIARVMRSRAWLWLALAGCHHSNANSPVIQNAADAKGTAHGVHGKLTIGGEPVQTAEVALLDGDHIIATKPAGATFDIDASLVDDSADRRAR